MQEEDLDAHEVQQKIAHYLLQQESISRVYTREQLQSASFTKGISSLIQNGFNQERSGDVVFVLDPGYIIYPEKGTTHGSGFIYDTHVPLIFFGKGIRQGSTFEHSVIPDIAPTMSAMLGNSFPDASTGQPLIIMLED